MKEKREESNSSMMDEETRSEKFEYGSLSSLSHNDQLRYLFNEVYYSFIIDHVKFVELQNDVTSMRPHAGEILAADREKGAREAAILFMDRLKDVSQEGKYEELLQALKRYEYQIVVNAIEKGEIEHDHDEHKKLLSVFYSHLEKAIDVPELALELHQKEVINSEELKRIRNMTYGALFELIDVMPRKHPKWFELFLEALYSLDKWNLCELLHENWFNKKKNADDHCVTDSSDDEIPGEIESSVYATRHVNPMSPPVTTSISSSVGTSPSPELLQVQQASNPSASDERFYTCQCGPKVIEMQKQIQDLQFEVKCNSDKLDKIMSMLMNLQK